jgi:co-chaperonin GroES (HSP10)
MIKVEYDGKFKRASAFFELQGNKMLIERLDLGEVKTAGGIIIAESNHVKADLKTQKPHVGVVVAVGKGYFDAATNTYTPLEVQIGEVVLLNSMGVQYYATLPGVHSYASNKIGLTTEGDVQMRFRSVEAFKAYADALNS